MLGLLVLLDLASSLRLLDGLKLGPEADGLDDEVIPLGDGRFLVGHTKLLGDLGGPSFAFLQGHEQCTDVSPKLRELLGDSLLRLTVLADAVDEAVEVSEQIALGQIDFGGVFGTILDEVLDLVVEQRGLDNGLGLGAVGIRGLDLVLGRNLRLGFGEGNGEGQCGDLQDRRLEVDGAFGLAGCGTDLTVRFDEHGIRLGVSSEDGLGEVDGDFFAHIVSVLLVTYRWIVCSA